MQKKSLQNFLQKNRQRRLNIHVLGDAMIDEYYQVKVNRISPEFPMPIMLSSTDEPVRRPGGAANVAYQFKNFNAVVTLHCLPDKKAEKVFRDHHIQRWSMVEVGSTLPVKRRFLDGKVQITRHDIESPLCGTSVEIIDFYTYSLCQEIVKHKMNPDVAIFSDYNKGFFNCDEHNLLDKFHSSITIVDPKKGPLRKWHGCNIFKPNAKEAFELSGKVKWREQVKHFQNELECESVVITDGGRKVSGIYKEEFFCFRPDKQVEVESVIGAGDTFCVFLALAVGHGFTVPEAIEIAWTAGSVYVQNNLNRPIVPAELSPTGIVNGHDLTSRDFKLVFTNGCFDLLHEGHLQTLRFAREKGDKLVVALNTDESVKRLKGDDRPIKPLSQRMSVVSALEMVDFVVSFHEDTPLEIIKVIQPDVLVKGADYSKNEIVGADIVSEVFTAPMIPDLSTTKLLS